MIFDENGDITFAYADIDPCEPLERGGRAPPSASRTRAGTIGVPVPAPGDTGWPVRAGRHVPAQPARAGHASPAPSPARARRWRARPSRSAGQTADHRGQRHVPGRRTCPAGTYAVIATRRSGTCRGSVGRSTVTVGTDTETVVDFALAATPAGAGYTLAEQPVTYTPAEHHGAAADR